MLLTKAWGLGNPPENALRYEQAGGVSLMPV